MLKKTVTTRILPCSVSQTGHKVFSAACSPREVWNRVVMSRFTVGSRFYRADNASGLGWGKVELKLSPTAYPRGGGGGTPKKIG